MAVNTGKDRDAAGGAGEGSRGWSVSPAFRGLLPWLLGGAAFVFAMLRALDPSVGTDLVNKAAYGSFLLFAVPGPEAAFNMPLFGAALAAVSALGVSYLALAALLQAGLCWLVFAAGRLAAGYWAGTGALAALALLENSPAGYNMEQAFYGFFLLLALCLLLERRRADSAWAAVRAGLAVGMSLLVRVPLFLFPLFYPLAELAAVKKFSRALAVRAALLAAAAYALLLPWSYLNHSLTGEFSLANKAAAATNIITGALGAVYTMEGDARELAGLGPEDDALSFFFRTVLSAPADYALSLARRLYHIFFFYPLLFGAFAAALLFNRDRSLLPPLALPAYFMAVHAPFSVEPRYFYPMVYVMPPLVAAVLAGRLRLSGSDGARPGPGLKTAFAAALCAAAFAEALVLAYPSRAADGALDRTAASLGVPGDLALGRLRCDLLRDRWGSEAYLACLEKQALAGDEEAGCMLAAFRMPAPRHADLPAPPLGPLRCLSVRLLRGLELGDRSYAAENYRLAAGQYFENCAMLRGEPHARDRELAARLRLQAGPFWTSYVQPALLLWPPGRRPALLAALRENFKNEPGFDLPEAKPAGMPGGDAARAKKLADGAVEKMKAGDSAAAFAGIKEALGADPSSPEALITLCSLRAAQGRAPEAAEACGLAFCSVYSAPARQTAWQRALASEAALGRHALLLAAGEKRAAGAFLRDCAASLPRSWPGAEKIRAELAARGGPAGAASGPCPGLDYSGAQ